MSEIWDRPAAFERMLALSGQEPAKPPATVAAQLGRISVGLAILAAAAFLPLVWLGGNDNRGCFFLPAWIAYASMPAAGLILAVAARRQREDARWAEIGQCLNILGLLGVPVFFVAMVMVAFRGFGVAG